VVAINGKLNIETCVTQPCKSGTKSRVSPQPEAVPASYRCINPLITLQCRARQSFSLKTLIFWVEDPALKVTEPSPWPVLEPALPADFAAPFVAASCFAQRRKGGGQNHGARWSCSNII
jgi:hypothetical protein